MFILSNFSNKNKPLTITKKDSKNYLSLKSGKLFQFSETTDIPMNFYCITDNSIKEIEFHSFDKEFDFKNEMNLEEGTKYDAEMYFGTKTAKKLTKKKISDGRKYINKEEAIEGLMLDQPLLPKLNSQASTPQDSFKIEKIFSIKFLRAIRQKNVKKSNLNFERTEENETESKIIDYFYHTLNSKKSNDFISEIPKLYRLFEQSDTLKVKKNKILVCFYIVFFMIKNYSVSINEFPTFSLNIGFLRDILKMIGCRKSGSNYVMDKWPEKKVEKKVKGKR